MPKAQKGTLPVDKAQADIRQLMGPIPTVPQQSVAPTANEKPDDRSPIIYDSPSADPPAIPTVRDPGLSNSYARALFFDHTNASRIVESRMLGRSEKSKEKYANSIYETYVSQPSLRIREPLHRISFDTTYHEGLFRMAHTMPLNSAEQLTAYRNKLRSAGVNQLCFVDMTANNCVLEDQKEIIAKVKARFNNWSAKLNKLTEYLTRSQRIREQKRSREREIVRKAVLEDSNLKILNSGMLQNLLPKLIDEVLRPNEPGMLPILRHFQFNKDSLNRRYKIGKYSSNRLFLDHVAIFTNNSITSSSEVSLNSSIISDISINQTENVGVDLASRESLLPTSKNVLVGIESLQQTSVLSVSCGAPKAAPTVDRHFQSPTRNAQEKKPTNESTSQASPLVTKIAAPNTEVDKVSGKPHSYFTLRFVKQNTNVHDLLQTSYQSLTCGKLSDAELETFVVKYYKKFRNLFAVNQLPQGLRLLTVEERAKRAHQRKSKISTAREIIEPSLETTRSRQSHANSSVSPPPPKRHCAQTKPTPKISTAREIIEPSLETTRSRQSHANSSVSPPPPKRHCAQTKPSPSRKKPIVYDADLLNENEQVFTDPAINLLASQELETPDSLERLYFNVIRKRNKNIELMHRFYSDEPTGCGILNIENRTIRGLVGHPPRPGDDPRYDNYLLSLAFAEPFLS